MTHTINLREHIGDNRDIVGVALLNTISRAHSGDDLVKFLERIGYKDGDATVEAHLVIGGEVMDVAETFKEFENQINDMITKRAKALLQEKVSELQNKLYYISEAVDEIVVANKIGVY